MAFTSSIGDVVFSWRGLIYRVTGAAALVAVIVSLLLPNWYDATATFVPPQERETGGGVLRMFTQMGVDFGGTSLLSTTPTTDLMIGILKSRRVGSQVVDRFGLAEIYGSETREHAIKDLEDHLRVDTTPEGLVEVTVEDRDRGRAAAMANAFVDFLDEYNRASSVEQARRTREFIEEMLAENRGRLEKSAGELREFRQTHTTVELTEQTRVTVEAIAELESRQGELEIQRGVLRSFSSPNGVPMRQNEAELREVRKQLDNLKGAGAPSVPGEPSDTAAFLPLADIPGLAFELADLTREVMVQEKVYQFLSSQLEEARIQEARDLQSIKVLDEAVAPLKKARPRRGLICILTVLLAFIGSVGVAFLADGFLEHTGGDGPASPIADSRESRVLFRILSWLQKWGGPKGERRGSTSLDA